MRFHISSFLAILFFCLSAHPALSAEAGYFDKIHGEVFIQHNNSDERIAAQARDKIEVGDTVFIGKNGYANIIFLDESSIDLSGDGGQLTVDKYIFDPEKEENNSAKFSVLKSSFAFVGGLLDKGDEEKVQIQLDFGSIGVRGTKVLRSMKDGECWIYLEDGFVRVFNDGGEVFLKPGEGTRMHDTAVAPNPVSPWDENDIEWIHNMTKAPKE